MPRERERGEEILNYTQTAIGGIANRMPRTDDSTIFHALYIMQVQWRARGRTSLRRNDNQDTQTIIYIQENLHLHPDELEAKTLCTPAVSPKNTMSINSAEMHKHTTLFLKFRTPTVS